MKRTSVLLALLLALLLAACGGKGIVLSIDVSPGDGQEFVYSHGEVHAQRGRLTLSAWAGQDLGDAEVALLPTDDTRPPEPFHLPPDTSVTVDVEAGKWYKVGVRMPNTGEELVQVCVEIKGGIVGCE